MIKKPDFKDVKHELIKTYFYIFPKLTEENFSILTDKINEMIEVVNEIQRTLDDQETYNMEMKERG